MPRQVTRSVTTGADGRTVKTTTVHKDKPRKTVDKIIRKETGGPTGEKTKSRSRTVTKK